MRGLFVTATDTAAGKTVLSAALLAAMTAAGERVQAHKPVVTGLDDPDGDWPADHELLASIVGMAAEEVAPLRYGPAVSPHLAAELAGEQIQPEQVIERVRLRAASGTVIVEGVGGLLVPLASDFTVCDLAVALELPILIAARPGLGTINHTLLTLNAARSAGLQVCAVVLTPWPSQPTTMQRSNSETIARLGNVEVVGLPSVASPQRAEFANAGAELPWRRWLSAS